MTEPAQTVAGAQPTVPDGVAEEFDVQRPRLHALAYRMLGSHWDADDAVQETWIRLQSTDVRAIDNLAAWLTRVTSRICIDQLRRASTRHEDLDADLPEPEQASPAEAPESAALTSDSLGAALLVLEELPPLERLALVLHDVFGVPFDEIAPIVHRSSPAARQLASRARRRVASIDVPSTRHRRSDAVDAFLKASREGDFGSLLQLLDPEIRLRADSDVLTSSAPFVNAGAPQLASSLRGADAVARAFAGRMTLARPALIDGLPGAVYGSADAVTAVYAFRLHQGRITGIEVIGNPQRIAALTITALPA